VTYGVANVLIGQGDGTFTAGATFRTGNSVPYGIAAADFNGDGWDDFAVGNGDGGGADVYLNQADGGWFFGGFYATGASPEGVIATDLNGDSRPDLAVANAGANSTSVLVNAADWQPWLRIDGVTVTEGNTGTSHAAFTVRIWPAPTQTVTVSYATVDVTAWAPSDYVAASEKLTFSPGAPLSQTVMVAVKGDSAKEYEEYFSVQLSSPIGATIANSYAYGAIVDDDPYVTIGREAAPVNEGNTGTTAMTFTVSLSAAYDQPVTVTYVTSDGSATAAGGDYQTQSGSVTFGPGETSRPITVLINGDRLGESDEYFTVNLTGTTAGALQNGGNSVGYGTILDDEPWLSINSVSIKEGPSGTRVMKFTVTLSAAYDQPISVRYATQDGSAIVADNDYVATSGTLTFAPGERSKTISVVIKGDRNKEADEYFRVLLSDASSNADISNGYGWGTIFDDDGPTGRR
jgi:hypothetical protein